jgi:hypothetical protein
MGKTIWLSSRELVLTHNALNRNMARLEDLLGSGKLDPSQKEIVREALDDTLNLELKISASMMEIHNENK